MIREKLTLSPSVKLDDLIQATGIRHPIGRVDKARLPSGEEVTLINIEDAGGAARLVLSRREHDGMFDCELWTKKEQ